MRSADHNTQARQVRQARPETAAPRGCTNLKLRQLSRAVTRHYDTIVAPTGKVAPLACEYISEPVTPTASLAVASA